MASQATGGPFFFRRATRVKQGTSHFSCKKVPLRFAWGKKIPLPLAQTNTQKFYIMSKSNTPLTAEQAIIKRLNEEVAQLKAQVAILERNHTLVCGQRDTAKEIADMWYQKMTKKF